MGYDIEPALTVMAPTQRQDHYEIYHGRSRVLGVASYSRFRQFQVKVDENLLKAALDVSYQSEPVLGMLVPVEMHELYEGRRNNSRIEAVATYGRFRPLHK